MDATIRDLDAVGAVGAKVSFQSLEVDTFTYSVPLKDVVPTTEILPENGQKVVLYRNGVRFFTGYVQRSQSGYMISVTVYGAWWWLQRLTMTSAQADSASTTSARTVIQFNAQTSTSTPTTATASLSACLSAVVSQAVGLGAPITSGSYAATFPCPQITLNQSTCGDAIAELVRLTPDVMPWFDYSTTTPTFNTARRSSATVRTLAIGSAPLETWNVNPQIELKADFVRLPYLKRGTDGKRVWGEQLSGDAGTAQGGAASYITLRSGASAVDHAYNGCTVTIISGAGAGQTKTIASYTGSNRRATISGSFSPSPNNTSVYVVGSGAPASNASTHVLTVSGQELDTYLPDELFESYDIQTLAPTTETLLKSWIMANDPNITQVRASYANKPADDDLKINVSYSYGISAAATSTSYTVLPAPTTYTNAETGAPVTLGNLLLTPEPPDWLMKHPKLVWTKVKVTGELSYEFLEYAYSGPNYAPPPSQSYTLPSWWGAVTFYQKSGSRAGGFRNHGDYALFWHSFEVEGWSVITTDATAMPAAYPTKKTLYRPADYTFIHPPPGFAAGLQESQGFVPYVGSLTLREQNAGGTRYRGCVINLTGGLPELSSMKALVQSEEIDIDSGTTTLTLGAPPRLSYQDFVSRIRKTSQDNILYL